MIYILVSRIKELQKVIGDLSFKAAMAGAAAVNQNGIIVNSRMEEDRFRAVIEHHPEKTDVIPKPRDRSRRSVDG